jgi:hypothetical protein
MQFSSQDDYESLRAECYGLNKKYPPQTRVLNSLVPYWWHYVWRFWKLGGGA